jgi:hypothetical protein
MGKQQRNGSKCNEAYVENDLREVKRKMRKKLQIKETNECL